jgi:hypothetical protein
MGDSAISAWISPSASTNGNLGETYRYQTTFALTGAEAATFTLSGRWAADDVGTALFLNGASTGFTALGFTSWASFNLTSGFTAGVNTLDFFVLNSGGGPTGLRVEFDHVNVSDSGNVALLVIGAGWVLARAHRRRR